MVEKYVIPKLNLVRYTEGQKSCTTLPFVILFQTLTAFENSELRMNGQAITDVIHQH